MELDLSRAEMLPKDLFQGMNPRKAEAFEPFGWWYAREFPAPESAPGERVFLRLDGVDCLAEYFLNGERIGASENAFMPHEFDVTDRLRPQNALWVHIRSALLEQLSQPYAQYLLTGWHIDGGASLRKPAHSFGWDIFPRAVTAGLWKSVCLAVRDAYAFAELGYRVRFDRVQTPSLEFYFSVDAPLESSRGRASPCASPGAAARTPPSLGSARWIGPRSGASPARWRIPSSGGPTATARPTSTTRWRSCWTARPSSRGGS